MPLTRLVIDYKDSVIAATTGAVTLTGGAPNTVDGVSLALNDRVLVKNQANVAQNGIYRVSTLGTGSNGTWSRANDFDDWRKITPGSMVFIDRGSTNGNAFYFIRGGLGNVVIDSTAINFSNLTATFASGGIVGGGNTQVQFNDAGNFGGIASFNVNKTTGRVEADTFRATNNGGGTNFFVGDDTVIGDINIANTMSLRGQQDGTQAYLVFGNSNSTNYIGRSGTNPITVTGDFSVTGVTTSGGFVSNAFGGEGGQLTLKNIGNVTDGLTVDVQTANVGRLFQTSVDSTLQIGQLAGTGGIVTIFTQANERVRINASGFVGIANTNPLNTLSVSGNAFVSSLVTVGNLVTSNGLYWANGTAFSSATFDYGLTYGYKTFSF